MRELTLRFPEAGDAESLLEAVRESLPQLLPWMPWCHEGYSGADAAQFIASRAAAREAWEAFDFLIVGAQGKLLGLCGINAVNRDNRFANLGYWLRTSATGRGVAVRAVGLLSRWVFAHTDLARLEIVVAVGNAASRRGATVGNPAGPAARDRGEAKRLAGACDDRSRRGPRAAAAGPRSSPTSAPAPSRV